MLGSVKDVLSGLSFPSFLSSFFPRTMEDKFIQHLLDPSHVTSPDAMLFYYTQSIIHSRDPVPRAVERIKVVSGTVSKDPNPPQHEFIIFDVKDSKRVFPNRKIVTERTVGDMPAPAPKPPNEEESNDEEPTDVLDASLIRTFFEHPKSKELLDVIQRNIQDSPSTSAVVAGTTLVAAFTLFSTASPSTASPSAASPSAASPSTVGSASTLALASTLGSAAYLSANRKSSSPLLPLSNPELAPQDELSYYDIASLKLIQSVAPYTSSDVDTPAEDRFLGENFLNTKGLGMGHNAWSHKPDNLNLLALIVLVFVVHQQRPLYSILGDQCYWFANIVLTALRLLFPSSNPDDNSQAFKKKTGVVFMPFSYLPGGKVAGRFRGVKVSAVEEFVLATICDLFRKRYDEEMAKASSHFALNY